MYDSTAEEPPRSKKEKTSLSSLSSLPDEVALSCLARVPRSDHTALALVSKRYRSLVASPDLYKIRPQLGYTCFYVCMSTRGPDSTPRWFIISREETVNRLMTPIPSSPSHPLEGFSVVSLDWGIYVIGGWRKGDPRSSDVLLLDCRTHTWNRAPSMGVARAHAAAGVVDGKIYVLGGCKLVNDYSYGEVFDPKTQTWDSLQCDRGGCDLTLFSETLVMDEKVYAVSLSRASFLYYMPNEGKWGRTKRDVNISKLGIQSYCFCATERLLYGCDGYGNVFWRESEELEWKKVKGLGTLCNIFHKPVSNDAWEMLPSDQLFRCYSKLINFGMNIVIIWFKYNNKNEDVDIWCAEISFERRQDKGDIWGKIEWMEAVARIYRHPLSHVKVLYSAYVNV